jgi:serine/threonine protein phosphatase PrpC
MLKITVDTALRQNHAGYAKPLEDYVLIDNEAQIYIVMDGVSRDKVNGLYPNPSPSAEVSAIFAEEVLGYLKQVKPEAAVEAWLREAARHANQKINQYNRRASWDFLPGTVGIISVIRDDMFYYIFAGDCSGWISQQAKARLFTFPQTRLVHAHRAEFSASEIRNVICNNKNHPCGYGVFTGAPGVMDFLEFGAEALRAGDALYLATDGLDALLGNPDFQLDGSLSAKELIEAAEQLETDQKLKSDDKAIIAIRAG